MTNANTTNYKIIYKQEKRREKKHKNIQKMKQLDSC